MPRGDDPQSIMGHTPHLSPRKHCSQNIKDFYGVHNMFEPYI